MTNNSYSLVQSQLSSVWPEWKITRPLGKGTFGQVYEILRNDLGTGYRCALKVLQMISYESDSDLDEFVRGVSREIDMMMQLKGAPNIVSIEDYAVLRGDGTRTILIRMELLENVEKYIKQTGSLDLRQTLQLGIDICTALVSCEQLNIIHRDIKLSNIFYSNKAGYKLGDFGISRTMNSIHEKMSMSSAGTIQYMAPEVYFGYRYDNTVDIYSLGVALYILLNNNLPPLGDEYKVSSDKISMADLHEANMRRLRGENLPRPANADDRLGAIICAACSPEPANRFHTAAQFRNALLAYRENKPVILPAAIPRVPEETMLISSSPTLPVSSAPSSSGPSFSTPSSSGSSFSGPSSSGLSSPAASSVSSASGQRTADNSHMSEETWIGTIPGGAQYSSQQYSASPDRTERHEQVRPAYSAPLQNRNAAGAERHEKTSSGTPLLLYALPIVLFAAAACIVIFFIIPKVLHKGTPAKQESLASSAGQEQDSSSGEQDSDSSSDGQRTDSSSGGQGTDSSSGGQGTASSSDGQKTASASSEQQANNSSNEQELNSSSVETESNSSSAGQEDGYSSMGQNSGQAEASPFMDTTENAYYYVTCVDTRGYTLDSNLYADTDGNTITVTAPEIEGYTPTNDEITFTLDKDEDNNIIFVYEPEETAPDYIIPEKDFLLYQGHTYFAYETSAIDSFDEAQAYCESLGGYMAVINDSFENEALYDYVFYSLGLKSAYFGLTDQNIEGNWEWVDGTPYEYESWGAGQPDNLRNVENYALFYYKDTPYTWNDGDFGKDRTTGKVIFLIEWDVQQ